MLKILGTSALSGYRLGQLLTQFKVFDSAITAVIARYIHFVDVNDELELNQKHTEML
jgi:phosphoribosylformylglycinamidine synthase